MSDLKKEAEKLGIDVDGRWSDDTLREKIAEAKGKDSKQESKPAPANKSAPADANADSLPTLGGPRVASSEELRQEAEGENAVADNMEPKEAHDLAVERSQRETEAPEFDTSDIENDAGDERFPIRLLNDWWDKQGIRHKRGSVVEVPYNEALRLVEARKAERADAMKPVRG